ncbi:hypothetical protein QBC42DRAFT_228950 [Cladorrhinum samala]|uniref:Uncharacterized protein n=1 Tax=Cladorrhinum samala TaxID=585594 RepID=A0AAV9HIW0_9PEZI|nr:hypothetical protein QBC42DRAFT_228950 [Cladorrhinum samala]
MPHKHTRREKKEEEFELPPTKIARPLPTTTRSKKTANAAAQKDQNNSNDPPKKSQKRKRAEGKSDDAPRAFKRLMAFKDGKLPRSGLDNGDAPKGKAKKKAEKKAVAAAEKAADEVKSKPSEAATGELKIRPGEKLWEFNQRVDAALPISGLVTKTAVKDGKDPLGIKVKRTLKERKMHNMYAEWREMDRKFKEKREEEMELEEEKELENEEMGVTWKLDQEAQGKKKKKGKRAKYIGEENGPEGDPWEEIKKKRGEKKVGLNDVAQAPPELKKPKLNSLVRGAKVEVSDIPKAAGSLRQREELQGIREDVVAQYRKLMEERRAAAAAAGPSM